MTSLLNEVKYCSDRASSINSLLQVDVPLLNTSDCNNLFKLAALDEHVSDDIWVCAGYREGGKDACDVSLTLKVNSQQ